LSESGLEADMVCQSCEASMAGGRQMLLRLAISKL